MKNMKKGPTPEAPYFILVINTVLPELSDAIVRYCANQGNTMHRISPRLANISTFLDVNIFHWYIHLYSSHLSAFYNRTSYNCMDTVKPFSVLYLESLTTASWNAKRCLVSALLLSSPPFAHSLSVLFCALLQHIIMELGSRRFFFLFFFFPGIERWKTRFCEIVISSFKKVPKNMPPIISKLRWTLYKWNGQRMQDTTFLCCEWRWKSRRNGKNFIHQCFVFFFYLIWIISRWLKFHLFVQEDTANWTQADGIFIKWYVDQRTQRNTKGNILYSI